MGRKDFFQRIQNQETWAAFRDRMSIQDVWQETREREISGSRAGTPEPADRLHGRATSLAPTAHIKLESKTPRHMELANAYRALSPQLPRLNSAIARTPSPQRLRPKV